MGSVSLERPTLEETLKKSSSLRITVVGRKSKRERKATLWYVYDDGKVYLLAHRDVQWWRNLEEDPHLKLQLDDQALQGVAKIVLEKMEFIYQLFRQKYGDRSVEHWYEDSRSNRVPFEVELLRGD